MQLINFFNSYILKFVQKNTFYLFIIIIKKNICLIQRGCLENYQNMKSYSICLTEQQCQYLNLILPKTYCLKKAKGTQSKIKNIDRYNDNSDTHSITPVNQLSSKNSDSDLQTKGQSLNDKPVNRTKKVKTRMDSNDQPNTQNIDSNSTSSNNPFRKIFISILNEIQKKRSSEIFLQPVDPIKLGIPTYFNVIKHPMDLQTMRQKANSKKYSTFKDFNKDLQLIVSNCLIFNAGNLRIIKIAQKFQKDYKQIIEEHQDKIQEIQNQKNKNQLDKENYQQKQSQDTNNQKIEGLSSKKTRISAKLNKKISQKKQKNQQPLKNEINHVSHSEKIDQQKVQTQKNIVSKTRSEKQKNSHQKLNISLKSSQQKQTSQNLKETQQIISKKPAKKSQPFAKQKQTASAIKQTAPAIKIPKFPYEQRLKIISRIRKLDKSTMAQLFKSINFSQGEVMDFKVLSDQKVYQIQSNVTKYQKIHEEKLKILKQKENQKSKNDSSNNSENINGKQQGKHVSKKGKKSNKSSDKILDDFQIKDDSDYHD